LNKLFRYTFLKFLLALIFVCQTYVSLSQTPYYYKINEENGLPSSEVYQIIQDDFGYIWIGCDAGLYRYDGIRFKSYSSKKQNSRSISGLKIDKDKNLWCQNFSGQIYRVTGDSLTLVIDASSKISSYSQYTIDKELHIWIANIKTIECYDFNGKKLSSFAKLNHAKDTICWQEVEVNTKGDIYLSSQKNGIALVYKSGVKYDVSFLDSTSTVLQRIALESYNNSLVALTEVTIKREYIISLVSGKTIIEKNRFLPFTKDGLIYKVYKDNLNRHWLCTSSGVIKLNQEFKIDDESKFFFNNDKISCIYQDKEGSLWISSLQNGIYVIPNYELSLYDEQSSTLSDHNITALLKSSKNELLVGTYTGSIYRLNENNSFELFSLQKQTTYRTVKKMNEWNGGLYVAHGPLSFFDYKKETVFNAYNFRDFCWKGDSLFFVTSGAFGYYPKFHSIANSELGTRAIILHNRGCRALTIDRKTNTIYFASIDGLFKYSNGKTSEIKLSGKSIFANKLIFLFDQLWVGSVNEGLYILQNDKVWRHYHQGNLLHGNGIKSFKIVNESVFVATEQGLTKINHKKQESEFFDYSDGIVSKEINDIEYFNGTIILGTNKGLLKLPSQITKNTVYPNIEITSVSVNQLIVNTDNQLLDLKYNENNIDIDFNTACLRARGNFKYKYRLLGLDATWHYNSGINNHIQYASLPSGEFIFEIRAVNEDGLESFKTEQVKFIIKSPFWQRWWFYVLMVLLGSGVVAILFMIRIRFITRRAELRNKVTASQLTALKSQMNPHFLFNTLNSLQDLILKHDIKNSNYYLNKFSLLMREILDMSGKDEVPLSREIKLLDTYLELEKLRFGDEFKFEIKTDETLDIDHLVLPPMIIQPFIENALKHGLLHKKGDKNLSVEFSLNDEILICEIIDNGVGRKRSEEIKARNVRTHQSFATEATDKRMDLLNSFNDKKYNFEIIDLYEDDKALGTKVIISIPV
jgi:ligand-binding sensor domain-containing protein